jgi:pyridoxamine 5'-phosphate oxidase-like protein
VKPPARSKEQRKDDVLAKLREEVDLWVASADAEGNAYLVPLSFVWDGSALTMATPRASRTARNLVRAGWARVGLGPTRDVVMIDGPVELVEIGADPAREDAHTRATGFDARAEPEDYVYLVLTPRTILAWREANELPERRLMRDGEWLV